MILKIRGQAEDTWRIEDGIKSAAFGDYNSKRVLNKENDFFFVSGDGEALFEPEVVIVKTGLKNLSGFVEGKAIGWVEAKMENGEMKFFVFDTVAYLCNDSGKTIEKIEGGI